MGHQGWKQSAGKNGVKHLLRAKPYIVDSTVK